MYAKAYVNFYLLVIIIIFFRGAEINFFSTSKKGLKLSLLQLNRCFLICHVLPFCFYKVFCVCVCLFLSFLFCCPWPSQTQTFESVRIRTHQASCWSLVNAVLLVNICLPIFCFVLFFYGVSHTGATSWDLSMIETTLIGCMRVEMDPSAIYNLQILD